MISSIRSVIRLGAGIARGTAHGGEYLVRRVLGDRFAIVQRVAQGSRSPEPGVADAVSGRRAEPRVGDVSRSLRAEPERIRRPERREQGDVDPHHALNTPVGEPDPTEWPDPYDHRVDPRDPVGTDGMPFGEPPHPPTGSRSTSEPHPSADPEAVSWEGPKRDKLDQ